MKQITTILLLLISLSGIGQVSPPTSHTIIVAGSGTSGGTTKYSTTEYGMLTDSATTNLYKFRVDTTVMESQARAVNRAALNVTLSGTQTITGDKTFIGNTVVPNLTYPALTNKAVNSNYVDGALGFVGGLKWDRSGNVLTAGSDFLGSTNNVSLRLRTNGIERAVLDSNGSLNVGTSTSIPSSKLTVESTTQGILIPRMTTTQRDAISSPAIGLGIYNTTDSVGMYYDGTSWKDNGSAIVNNALTTTQNTFADFRVVNNTPATVGAQKISPSIGVYGNGWKTAGTAESQRTGYLFDVVPTQGSAAPTSVLNLTSDINGTKTVAFQLSSVGGVSIAAGLTMANTALLTFSTRAIINSTGSGIIVLRNAAGTDFDRLVLGGTGAGFPAIKRAATTAEFVLADNSGFAATQSLYDRFGSGTPEGVVTAPVGAAYHRTDGGTGTSFYVKESGTGNTGWIAK